MQYMYFYSEDAVFGPFTMRQVVPLFIGGMLAMFFASDEYSYGKFVAAACCGIAVALAYHLRPTKIEGEEAIRAYFQNPDGAKRMQKKVAELTAQLGERKAKGFTNNAPLEEALLFLEKIAREHGPTSR